MNYEKPRFTANQYFEEQEEKEEVNFFDKIETTIHLTRKEAEEKLIAKDYDTTCILEYEGERRNGVIMSEGTNGSMKIGIFREE